LAIAGALEGRSAVDGEKNGPVSKEQPEAQPVAAGPTKVGEYSPNLDDVMALVTGAAATPEAATSATAIHSSANLDWPHIGFLH
jgi:hypothetical protein